MRTLDEVLAFARRLYDAPYEVFTRFLLERPHHLEGEEALAHLEAGGGLSCSEKARLLAYQLSRSGIPNAVVGGGFELWVGGVNLLQMKGAAREPPNEALISRFYAPERETSPYETPLHLAHWANVFTVEGEEHLVDALGALSPFRHFAGEQVASLLDRTPKAYVTYMPTEQRLYYHRLGAPLLALVDAKVRTRHDYILGRFLNTALLATPSSFLSLRWWWRPRAFEEELSSYPRTVSRASNGALEVRFCEGLPELKELLPELEPERWAALERAWPAMREAVARLFDSPPFVRFAVSRASRPLSSYGSNELRCD